MPEPSRGEVWLVDLNAARGHEQAGIRPFSLPYSLLTNDY